MQLLDLNGNSGVACRKCGQGASILRVLPSTFSLWSVGWPFTGWPVVQLLHVYNAGPALVAPESLPGVEAWRNVSGPRAE